METQLPFFFHAGETGQYLYLVHVVCQALSFYSCLLMFSNTIRFENNQQSPFHTAGYDKWMKQRFDLDFLTQGKDEQTMLYHKVFTDKGGDVGAKL